MNILLRQIERNLLHDFKQEMQEAFQKSFEDNYGTESRKVLPETDIDRSLQAEGAVAYEAIVDGIRVGGTIINISEDKRCNHLDFLYVKVGFQNKGIGKFIWSSLEAQYPKTQVWETCTPYFDQRNIHFYVNCCGFHIVEFFNHHHPDKNSNENFSLGDGMFRFEKSHKPK